MCTCTYDVLQSIIECGMSCVHCPVPVPRVQVPVPCKNLVGGLYLYHIG